MRAQNEAQRWMIGWKRRQEKHGRKVGDLQVWWIPQVPMAPFYANVASVAEGARVLDILAAYDFFQLAKNIKHDFSNEGGLEIYSANADGEGKAGWEEWFDEETGCDNLDEWRELQESASANGAVKP